MRLLIYGLGRSGLAVLRLARRQGHAVVYFDAREAGPDLDAAAEAGARRVLDAAEAGADLCIAAPGVPIDHPDLARLRAGGTPVIGEVEWVARTVPGRYLGVTGTAGKGTTTRWIADTLEAAGVDAVAGGNIDPALAAVAAPGRTHVVEMSSFQLERCADFHPEVAVVLNLGEDHIDRHGSVEAYHAAKRRLLDNLEARDSFVFNADDPRLAAWAEEGPARARGFSLRSPSDAWLEPTTQALHLDGAPLLGAAELAVTGRHQVANALAVALACRAVGLERDAIAAGLRVFRGLPGRYAPAGRIGDVRFIEDSIATRPLAVAAALRSTPTPLVWIAGGQDKRASLEELRPLVRERVSLLLGVGEAGPYFARAFASDARARVCPDTDGAAAMRWAAREALQHLRDHHHGSGWVLLAPLAASFDQFRDYRERAEIFRAAVRELEGAPWTPS